MSSGGGHGSSWIVTYSDMITLLMACFIMIVTFGTKERDKHSRRKDSLLDGKGGAGAVGPAEGTPRDSVLVRISPLDRQMLRGSEAPPLYSDPVLDDVEGALRALETTPLGTLADNYALRVPVAFLFAAPDRLSESGARLLQWVARTVRQLPYDVQVQASDARLVPQAVKVSQYLFQFASLSPVRLGVGVRAQPGGDGDYLYLALLRNR
jgi:hypothetical protein